MNGPGEEPEETVSQASSVHKLQSSSWLLVSTLPSALAELPQQSILALHCATAWPVHPLCVRGSGAEFFPLPAF